MNDSGTGEQIGTPLTQAGSQSVPLCGLTLAGLIEHYKTDPQSKWHGLRYHVRVNHDTLLRRLVADYGHLDLTLIDTRDIMAWYANWTDNGKKLASGAAFVGKLRTVMTHGVLLLPRGYARIEAGRIKGILKELRVEHGPPRENFLTFEQANLIRAKAHYWGLSSIALAQALQFELVLRQKDVIGEWVPETEPGESNVIWEGRKWFRGVRWSEIDDNLILRHITSKRQKKIAHNLNLSPMVVEELSHWQDRRGTDRPIVICEHTGMPWDATEFRRKWRDLANACGIPKTVRNMDSRSGGMSEGKKAGAADHGIQTAATHSSFTMTQRYLRDNDSAVEDFQRARVAHRARVAVEAKGG